MSLRHSCICYRRWAG